MGEDFIAPLHDKGPLGNAVQHILGDAQLRQVEHQAQLLHPGLHGGQTFLGDGLIGFSLRAHPPDVHCELLELLQAVGHHIPVVGQGDRRQGHAVGGVGVGAHRLADHVDHPVRVLSLGYQSVQGPSGDPHQVAPGLIVLRVLHCDPAAVEQRAHQALHEVVRGAVILPGEILLGDVVHNVVNAGHHLVLGQGIGILGVEDGERGKDLLPEDVADLLLGGVIGDYRAPVHLGTGAHHSQHTAHRQRFAIRFLKAQIIFFPRIFPI